MKKTLSIVFVAIFSLALICGGSFLFFGQDLFMPEIEQKVADEDDQVVSKASGYWGDSTYSATSFAGGSGTSSSPYLISTAAQLSYMAYRVNNNYNRAAYYKLSADVDMSEHYWTPIGIEYAFAGNFNGAGYTISGLQFNTFYQNESLAGTDWYVELCGLFGYCSGATLYNIVLSDVAAWPSALSLDDQYYFGSILAYGLNTKLYYSSLNNKYGSSTFKVSINANVSDLSAGALVGAMKVTAGTAGITSFYQCYANTSFYAGSSSTSANVNHRVGGLLGYYVNASTQRYYINNLYFRGHLDSYAGICGGIVGEVYGSSAQTNIQACYFSDRSTAYLGCMYGGGIVGKAVYTDIQSCFAHATGVSQRTNWTGTKYKGGTVALVVSGVYLYANCRTSNFSTSVGTGTATTDSGGTSIAYSSSLLTSSTYANFWTSSSYLAGTGGSTWNFSSIWKMPSGSLGTSYLNGGFPVLRASYVTNKNVTLYKQTGGTVTYAYYNYGDTTTTTTISNTTSTSSATIYQVNGGFVSLKATANTGYTFSGWRLSSSTGTLLSTATSYTHCNRYGTSTTTIYACFTLNTYSIDVYKTAGISSISFSPSTGSTAITTESAIGDSFSGLRQFQTYGTSLTVTCVVKDGYTFNGWKTTASPTASNVSTSTSYTFTVTGAKTLYAWTTPNDYTVQFMKNDGSDTVFDSATYTFDTKYGDTYWPSTSPTRTSFTFIGWFTASSGGSIVSSSSTVTTATKLYAHWNPQAANVYIVLVVDRIDGTHERSADGGSVVVSYYNTGTGNATSTNITTANPQADPPYVSTLINQNMRFTATAKSGYVFTGVNTSMDSDGTGSTSFKPTTANTSYSVYVHFKELSENVLKYDKDEGYFYFEDGEYPQSYIGYDLNEKLNNITAENLEYQYSLLTAYGEIPVYLYEGEKYAKVVAPETYKNLDLGNQIGFSKGEAYWFKVEPIRWRVSDYNLQETDIPSKWANLGTYATDFVAVSDKVLSVHIFEDTVLDGSFLDGSYTYSYLNSSILQAEIEKNTSNIEIKYATSGLIDVDYLVGDTGGQNKVETGQRVYESLVAASVDDLETNFNDKRAYASDLVCLLLGVNPDQFCDYWTRNLVNLNNANKVTEGGTLVSAFMQKAYGVRFSMVFKEGSSLGYGNY